MMDYFFYALAIVLLPAGALFAAYVAARENDRALDRDERMRTDHHG